MNGIIEPLPGLLDDPLFQIPDLPALTNFQIAPLRNPAPSRHANVPLPLEPVADNSLGNGRPSKNAPHPVDSPERRKAPKITPNDVLLAREAKRPHLAISELLEADHGPEPVPTYLPSFISLAVVEKSPIQTPSFLEHPHSLRRLRLDADNEHVGLDWTRHLPPPAQKEERHNRPAPLLPAMVTGLHEPPPSAALLPSMGLDSLRAVVAGLHEPPSSALLPSIDLEPRNATITGLHDPQPAALLPSIYSESIHTTGTGLHEPPPPPVAQLPSIDLDPIHAISRPVTTSRIHVRDMLTESVQPDPEPYLPDPEPNQPDPEPAILDPDPYHQGSELYHPSPEPYNPGPESDQPDIEPEPEPEPEPVPVPSGPIIDRRITFTRAYLRNNTVSPDEIRQRIPKVIHPVWKETTRKSFKRRTRRRWTDAETADLFAGVEKHGIGRWKQILDDPSFNFLDRNSVDLKDRYRVCINDRPSSRSDTNLRADSPIAEASPSIEILGIRHCREKADQMSSGQGSKQRRKRRAWTDREDENLLEGVARHGFQWTAIHDDPDLDLSHRRATDLRDRIRNKFPDGYKHAESAPLRSEVKKAEREAQAAEPTPWDVAVPGRELNATQATTRAQWESENVTATDKSTTTAPPTQPRSIRPGGLTRDDVDKDRENMQEEHDREREGEAEKEQLQPPVTLPSFSLGFYDDMDWEDNRLPPLHDWDEDDISD
ncbi:Myb-like DNA-binding domain-containing protein [Cladophialophora immunda]|nr:Myb-like DNA-binding domain-containing protein [Cladophialophora immunda]